MSRKMKNEDLAFSAVAISELKRFEAVINEMFALSDKIFMDRKISDLKRLHDLESQTDGLKDELSNGHFERIKTNACKNELSSFHSTLLSELERVADHLTNVGYSIVNPTGDEIQHLQK